MKLKPLPTTQRVLSWICVETDDESINSSKILFSFLIFTANLFGLISSVAFFLKFVSINLEQSLYTMFQISGTISTFYVSFIVFFSRRKISKLFQSLSKIYDDCKNKPLPSENKPTKVFFFLRFQQRFVPFFSSGKW